MIKKKLDLLKLRIKYRNAFMKLNDVDLEQVNAIIEQEYLRETLRRRNRKA